MRPPPTPSVRHDATTTKGALPPERRDLLDLLQSTRFGRIENLAVRDGRPVLAPPPRVTRDIRFGKTNSEHPMRGVPDFALRKEVIEMFEFFDREQSFQIQRLEVVDGIPIRMLVTTPAEA